RRVDVHALGERADGDRLARLEPVERLRLEARQPQRLDARLGRPDDLESRQLVHMILVDLGRGAAIASIPVFDYLGILSISWIFAMTFTTACLTIAFDSGEFAAVPSLVPKDQLVAANGRIMASYQAASVGGPLLAGLLVALVRISDVLVVDAASFAVSALSLSLIGKRFNAEEDAARERKHILRDVQEGLRYVLGHPVLRNISLMMALINLVGSTTWAQL